ncbi:TetR/AcrR family transcriptional regulator [Amycolatopsis anabasis]|uniref:TetR/AcrR family transcriptional regulator n=1 Tax=Amycolatopsis anabasis TaxID=1840409 RepID=UPI00131DDFE7|nr:TetR/AcrR family transcriptional regulator [Amycolatopsis anabasis]
MAEKSVGKTRKSRADWTAAALDALAEGGVAAVAMEPLAARLGTTKGSAYWHFANRDELLRSTLERWEAEHTEAVIEYIESRPDPRDRLHALLGAALRLSRGSTVLAAMLAAAEHPVVSPILNRVTDRRIGYLASLFADLGFGRAEARRRAVLAYSTYVGNVALQRALPDRLPKTAAAREAYVRDALTALTARGS